MQHTVRRLRSTRHCCCQKESLALSNFFVQPGGSSARGAMLVAHRWAAQPDADAVACATWLVPAVSLLCVTTRGALFSLAAQSASMIKQDFAPGAPDRVDYVESWGSALLCLCSNRLSCHVVTAQARRATAEPALHSPELGVVAFSCDAVSNRLCLSYRQRHAQVLRRVPPSSTGSGRFEVVYSIELTGTARELGWVVEKSGARWLVLSTDDALLWVNTETKPPDATQATRLAPASIVAPGRWSDEVLIVRDAHATLEGPKGPTGMQAALAEPASCAGVVAPFLVTVGAQSGDVAVFAESGDCVQVIKNRAQPRFAVAIHPSALAMGAKQYFTAAPLPDVVAKLLGERKYPPALALCNTRWAADFPGAEKAGELKVKVSREFGLALLMAPGGCSVADASLAASLLSGLVSLPEAVALFADSQLGLTPAEASELAGGDGAGAGTAGSVPARKLKFKPMVRFYLGSPATGHRARGLTRALHAGVPGGSARTAAAAAARSARAVATAGFGDAARSRARPTGC